MEKRALSESSVVSGLDTGLVHKSETTLSQISTKQINVLYAFYDLEVAYLGEARARAEYPMKSLSDAGVLLAGASDYPVQVPSPPLLGIALGVTRCEPGETDSKEVLGPEERMRLDEMIECFTINGARANFLEHETGSIQVGKKADMVVLEKNLFEIPETDIADTKVMMTVFEGEIVYRDTAFQ